MRQPRPAPRGRRLGLTLAALVALWAGSAITLGACTEPAPSTVDDAVCIPGSNVFCRCPAGEPGTRRCADDGAAFEECLVAPDTPCGTRVTCEPGTTAPCVCFNGSAGLKECHRDGSSFGECLVDGGPCPPTVIGQGGMGGDAPVVDPCSHELCETGPPLDPSCGDCHAAVCAVDAYCCETDWDLVCLGIVDAECGGLCGGPTECAHEPCVEGEVLDPTCDPCVAEVCATDPACCDANQMFGWDLLCVDYANDPVAHPACAGVCGCAHDECVTGTALEDGCSECVTAVCARDAFCCTMEWDDLCVFYANDEAACSCSTTT